MKKILDIYRNLADWPKKVFHNMNWLFLEMVFRIWFSFFIWTWIARYFWPKDFWTYNYALAFVWLFSFIANLWLDSITIRELVKEDEKKEDILWSVFFLKIIWCILAIIVINLLSYFVFYKDALQFQIILIISLWFVFQTFNIINLYFQSKVEWKYNVIASWIGFLFSNIFKVIIILKWMWIIYLAYSYLIDIVIWSFSYIYFYTKHTKSKSLNWTINKNITKRLLKEWLPLAIWTIAWYIYLRIDQIMIWNMLSSKEVWLYSVSVTISDATTGIIWIFWSSLFPALIASKKIWKEVYENRLKMYYSLFFIISFALALSIYLFADDIILLLFWNDYIWSIIILKIYIWSIVVAFFSAPLSQFLINENLFQYSVLSISFWALLSMIMNYILIPKFWLVWAAISTTIPSFLSLVTYLFVAKTRKIFIFSLLSFNPFYLLKLLLNKINIRN